MPIPDAARLSIFDSLVSSIADEMGATLRHTALSPNIKERADFSCAVFDAEGQLLAQAAHIPVHLGAMPESVRAVADLAPWQPGDLAILNDPFLGGTHLPDVTMVSPVFAEGIANPIGYVASRAHQADIGGMAPGSMPVAEELIQEGLVIPPLRLYRGGALLEEVLQLILRNVRTPDERRGDFAAQVAAQRLGERRVAALHDDLGAAAWNEHTAALLDYGERLARAALAGLPQGSWSFEDALDDDGHTDEPVPIRLELTLDGEQAHFDFTGSAEQRAASINAVAPVTRSACYYVIRCLLPANTPTNAGLFRPIRFTLPVGSVVAAQPPVAVAAGNVETSQRIVDTVWGAFAQILPERMPAASSGTMNNLTAGGIDPRTGGPWAYYETSGGGPGRRPAERRAQRGALAHDQHAEHSRRSARTGLPAAGAGEQHPPEQRRRGRAAGRRRADSADRVSGRGTGDADHRASQRSGVGRERRRRGGIGPQLARDQRRRGRARAAAAAGQDDHLRGTRRRDSAGDAGRRRLGRDSSQGVRQGVRIALDLRQRRMRSGQDVGQA